MSFINIESRHGEFHEITLKPEGRFPVSIIGQSASKFGIPYFLYIASETKGELVLEMPTEIVPSKWLCIIHTVASKEVINKGIKLGALVNADGTYGLLELVGKEFFLSPFQLPQIGSSIIDVNTPSGLF